MLAIAIPLAFCTLVGVNKKWAGKSYFRIAQKPIFRSMKASDKKRTLTIMETLVRNCDENEIHSIADSRSSSC